MDAATRQEIFEFGRFRLDLRAGGLFRIHNEESREPISLGSRALDVLYVVVSRSGELVARDEIMAAVWPDTVVEEANLTVQISTLRRVLDADRSDGSWLQTVPGRGYRFVGPVVRSATETEPVQPSEEVPVGGAGLPRSGSRQRLPVLAAIAALVVIAAGLSGWIAVRSVGWPWAAGEHPRLSVVVLPFANLSSDPEQDYFADAVTQYVTTDLSRISGSVVIAYSTALTYRNTLVDVRRTGEELGVQYVLKGSVRRIDDAVEVNAQLIDTGRAKEVWADRFVSGRQDLARAQEDIVGRLARTLNLEMIEAAGRRIEQENKRNPDAADLAMRGWALWYRPFSLNNRQAAAHDFDQALALDPQSVEAEIGAATVLIANVGVGSSKDPQQDSARAERLMLAAIEQDANSSRAHEVLGTLRRIQNRLDESRVELETSVSLDPNNAHALLALGQTLMFLGRPADAIPLIQRSMRLDPRDPNAAFGDWSYGACQLLLGHPDIALDALRKAGAENPRVYYFQIYLAGGLGMQGKMDEAKAALSQALALKPQAGTLAGWAAVQPWITNAAFLALRAQTLDVGLRRAGMGE